MFTDIYAGEFLHYGNWFKGRGEYCSANPCTFGKFRLDLELIEPTNFLINVPRPRRIDYRNSDLHEFYYICDEWTVIFATKPILYYYDKTPYARCLLESSSVVGERVILYSTSGKIWDEVWGQNPAKRCIFFRNKFWLVSNLDFIDCNRPVVQRYPLIDQVCKSTDSFLPATYTIGQDEQKISEFLQYIINKPNDITTWLIFCDWLAEQGVSIADYFRLILREDLNFYKCITKRLLFNYKVRPKNLRTAIFILLNLVQDAYSMANHYIGALKHVNSEDSPIKNFMFYRDVEFIEEK